VKVRFLADADLNKAIVTGVLRCEPEIDFLTAHAAGLWLIFANSRKLESIAPAFFSLLKVLTWQRSSRNYC